MIWFLSLEFGGLGLDYKYHAAYLEEMGTISAAGVAAEITVTEITLPALSRFFNITTYYPNDIT